MSRPSNYLPLDNEGQVPYLIKWHGPLAVMSAYCLENFPWASILWDIPVYPEPEFFGAYALSRNREARRLK